MSGIRILGCGHSTSGHKVTNENLSKFVDTTDEWIRTRTGIRARSVSMDKNTSELALEASKMALHQADIEKDKISLVIIATATADQITPSCSCMVAQQLDLSGDVLVLDVNGACSGFLYALQIADKMLQEKEVGLVIGAEVLSKIVNWSDRTTCVLFGDGAGACLVQKEEGRSMAGLASYYPDTKKALYAQSVPLMTEDGITDYHVGPLHMTGSEVFRFAVKAMTKAVKDLMEQQNLSLEQIDWLIPHQANERIIDRVAKNLGLEQEKIYKNLQNYGNTSAASIPIALSEACQQGLIRTDMNIVMVAFGAGFTCGAVFMKW